jgi:RHS repeat-associated protein
VAERSGRHVNYRYDGLYRLANETISSDPQGKNGTLGYTLDPVGNRTARASTLLAEAAASYSYDANDRLASETYDANGNALISQGNTYAYSFDNRLKSVNNGSITIVYDGDGNRVSKTVGGVTTRYLVDDLNPTGYPQVVEEVAGSGATRVYTYGIARISQNQVIAGAWAPSFYVYDGSDSVRFLTDGAATVTDQYDYDAFGNLINFTGSTPNNYLYGGEQFDPDLGLYYLRARYYSPVTGRFMSMDPANGDVIDSLSQHRYAYAAGNPVNLKDPTGKGFEEVGQLLSGITPAGLVIATLQTAAAACFAGTVVPVLGMAVITASGGEVYDVQTPFPCLVTFMARPKVKAIPRPRTAPAPSQTMSGCTPQELARRKAAQDVAEVASTVFGSCGCPKLRANIKIVLIEAFIAARLNVMACYSDGGNKTHWDQVDGLDINLARCVATAQACPN